MRRQAADPSKAALSRAVHTQGGLLPGGALTYQRPRAAACGPSLLPNLTNAEPAYVQQVAPGSYAAVSLATHATRMLRLRLALGSPERPGFLQLPDQANPRWVSSQSSRSSFWVSGALNTSGIVYYMVRRETGSPGTLWLCCSTFSQRLTPCAMQVFNFQFDPDQDFARLSADIKPSSSGLVPVAGSDADGYRFDINATACGDASWVPFKPSTTYFVVFAVSDKYAMTRPGAQNTGIIGATL